MSDKKNTKRDLLKKTGVITGSALTASVMPSSWTKPVVSAIMLPAHAQTSEPDMVAPAVSPPTNTSTMTSTFFTSTGTFSDVRLKTSIAPLGISKNGHQLYRFVYLDDPKQAEYVGVMAQDLEGDNKHALHISDSGYFSVDYAEINESMTAYKEQ